LPPANWEMISATRMMPPYTALIENDGTCARVNRFSTTWRSGMPLRAPNNVPRPPSSEIPPMAAAANTVKMYWSPWLALSAPT